MRATHNLKILAVIGGILSLTGIMLSVYWMQANIPSDGTRDRISTRNNLLHRMSRSEIRADFAILTSQDKTFFPDAYATKDSTLKQASQRYPESARIQLRVGTFAEGNTAVNALRKAAVLDARNALPLYLLASKAATQGSWNEAYDLLKQGNLREHSTGYPIQEKDLPVRGLNEVTSMMMDLGTEDEFGNYYYGDLRELARILSTHSAKLQSHGQTDSALAITGEVKKMGRAIMTGAPGNMRSSIPVLVGVAITRIALNSEKDIYTHNGDRAGLARVERERHETSYLKVGVTEYTNKLMDYLISSMRKFYAPPAAVGSIFLQIFLAFVYFAVWIVSAAKSRNGQASELHIRATEQAFPIRKLLMYYVLFFVPGGIAASYIFHKGFLPSFIHELFVLMIVPPLLSVMLDIYAGRVYTKAFRKQAEDHGIEAPKLRGKRAPIEEKREFNARMAGVHGGALIFLTICALGISMWMKSNLGSYPWKFDNVLHDCRKKESRYMGDLLNHKIVVSESAIRAEQQKLEKYGKNRQK